MRRLLSAVVTTAACAAFVGLGMPNGNADTTTLYVGPDNCSDSGSGNSSQPFCTISRAATVATAGHTVVVFSGTYSGPVTVANSGTAASPIVFQPAAGASVTVQGGAYGFFISRRSYVTVSGFTITGTVHNGISVSSSDHITISDNVVTRSGVAASGQVATGIALSGTTASTVTRNQADRNSDTGIYLTSGTTQTLVSHNEASFNARVYQRNANGINVVSPNNTIIGNVLHDNEDSGLQFYTGGDNNLATLNVSYNNGDHGIDDLNVTGGRLIGNTIFHNCTSGINVEGTSGNYLVENNIAADNAVYPAYLGIVCNRRAGNIGIWDSAPSSTTVNSNLVYLSTSGVMYVFGSSYSSLSAMHAATGQESRGIQANPAFMDGANWDLRLASGSPAIDSADSAASGEQSIDAAGAARVDDQYVANTGVGPRPYDDRGAYEFGGGAPPPNSPPTARLTVSPTSGTVPLPVTADASASSDPEGQTLSYRFDFGDGSTVGPQSDATAPHTYQSAGNYQVMVTVTDTGGLSSSTTATLAANPAGGGSGPITYIGQIATNYSTSPHTSGYVTVWRSGGVAAGDLVVATLALSGTTSGAVTGADDAGDRLTVASDVSDGAGHRLVVLSGVAGSGLAPNQRITATFPTSATYRLTADEVSGVVGVDRQVAAAGSGTSFSSGSTATTSNGSEFVFGAVGLFAGSSPTWASGWHPTATYAIGSDYLGRAYQVSSAPNSFAAAGTGSGAWLATTVTFD